MPDRLKEFQPDFVVMMVGKADFGGGTASLPDWLADLRLSRLIVLAISDIKSRLQRTEDFKKQAADHDRAYDPAWSLYGQKKYGEAVPVFEAAIRAHSNYEAGIRGLYHCYIQAGQFERGAAFFREVSPSSSKQDLMRILADSLILQSGKLSEEERVALESEMRQKIDVSRDLRSAFKSKLWLLQRQQSEEFTTTIENMVPGESTGIHQRTVDNLRKAFVEIRKAGAFTILVQYPTDHVEALKNRFGPLDPGVEIIKPINWHQREHGYRLIENDIEHVTGEGADAIAVEILQALEAHASR